MTEGQWFENWKPRQIALMIEHLTRIGKAKGKEGQRKLRLFACACCRRSWHLLSDERSREAVVLSERYADGRATKEELSAAGKKVKEAARQRQEELERARRSGNFGVPFGLLWKELRADEAAAASTWADQVAGAKRAAESAFVSLNKGRRGIIDMLRDIFSNPFHPTPSIAPEILAWNYQTVVKMTLAIYDEQAFDRLPILADALEDAGCDDATILDHCRQADDHVWGCWLVDLLLGK